MESNKSLKHLDLSISDTDFNPGVTQVAAYVRPKWTGSDIKIKVLTGGFNNKLLAINSNTDETDIVLIRIYGVNTELFIDRQQEVRYMHSIAESGLIPPVYCKFNNGICYGYSPGIVLDETLVRDPKIYPLIAGTFARLHTLRPEFILDGVKKEPEPCLFPDIRRFLALIPSRLSDPRNEERLKAFMENKNSFETEVNAYERHVKQMRSPIVFCHNDLSVTNVVYNAGESAVSFIDFEWGNYNYRAFDIGNHFCEFLGKIDGTFDPALYPDKPFQMKWLRHYLDVWHKLNGPSIVARDEKSGNEIENLYNEVNVFALASHLCWGIWAVAQSELTAFDYDYLGYAMARLQVYYDRKNELLGNV